MSRKPIPGILAALGLFLSTATAGAQGIAFSYAPEQGSGMCMGNNPAAALDCARQKCVDESGAAPQDCARVAWCYPAGWSVAVGIMHREGIHWSEFSCGWPSREAAMAAGQVRCDKAYREFIEECVVAQLWNEEGELISLEDGL